MEDFQYKIIISGHIVRCEWDHFGGNQHRSFRLSCYPQDDHAEPKPLKKVWAAMVGFEKWRCMFEDGPLHYAGDAVHFMQLAYGVSIFQDPRSPYCNKRNPWAFQEELRKALDNFKSVVLFGELPGDEMPTIVLNPNDAEDEVNMQAARGIIDNTVRTWCEARRPALVAKFQEDLARAKSLCEQKAEK